MKKHITILLIIVQINLLCGQTIMTEKEIDSTYNIWRVASFNKDDIAKLEALYTRAKKIDYKKRQIDILLDLANLEDGKANYSKSKEYLEMVKPLALSEGRHESYISACGLESKIYFVDHNYDHAKKILNQAYRYADKIKDLESRRMAKIEIYIYKYWAVKYSESPKNSYKDSLADISKKIYSEAIFIKNKAHRANRVLFAVTYAASTLVELKRIEEADKYLKVGEKQLKNIQQRPFLIADYYEAKGDFEYQNREKNKNYLDSALANYTKANKISESSGYAAMMKSLFPKMAKVYGDKKDAKKQLLFLEKGQKISDSLKTKENNSLNKLKKKIYTVNENDGKEITETSKRNTILLFSLLTILMIVVIIWILRKNYFNKKSVISETIPTPQNEIVFEEEMQIVPINRLLLLLGENDTSFYLAFLEVYPSFSDKLLKINPTMKSSDIEFCAYIKLNLETKQIAQVKKMSVRAVEGKKYRIRKKLNISTDENMYVWMSKI